MSHAEDFWDSSRVLPPDLGGGSTGVYSHSLNHLSSRHAYTGYTVGRPYPQTQSTAGKKILGGKTSPKPLKYKN